MELHRVQPAFGVLHRRDRDLVRASRDAEPLGRACDGVPVAHPHRARPCGSREQPGRRLDVHRRRPVLPAAGRGNLAAELTGQQLVAVADPQHGNADPEQVRVHAGSALGVDRRRPARQDDPGRTPGSQLGGRDVVGHDLGVHVALADPSRDQLGVLRSEVDHEDRPRSVGHDR